MNEHTDAGEWREIPGHPGYEVSSNGMVRSLDRVLVQKNGVPHTFYGRVLKLKTDRAGYQFVALPERRDRRVHQLVLEAFVGPRPSPEHVTLHENDVRDDNRVGNLRWGTQSDNIRDAVARRRHGKSRRTHCNLGHELKDPNLLQWHKERGGRACRACSLARRICLDHKRRHGVELDIKALADRRYAELMVAS